MTVGFMERDRRPEDRRPMTHYGPNEAVKSLKKRHLQNIEEASEHRMC